jgi:hypothetical protein
MFYKFADVLWIWEYALISIQDQVYFSLKYDFVSNTISAQMLCIIFVSSHGKINPFIVFYLS